MYASFQNVLFSFDNGTDTDLATYSYELYEEDDIVNPNTPPYSLKPSVTPLATGQGNSSVFAVPVEGSYEDPTTDPPSVVQKNFFGRVKAIDTSGNEGNWTAIVKTDPSTPLIDSQYVVSLTADKIKAGTIESAEIILGGANPAQTIIRSNNYQQGLLGWKIDGSGTAEFNDLTVRTSLDIGGNDATSFHVDINGNMWSGANTSGYASAPFRVSNAGALVATNANITGAITATSGSFSGTVNASGGNFTSYITAGVTQIGKNVRDAADHNGIALDSGSWNNAWVRRGDATVYFRAGSSSKYIQVDTGGSSGIYFPNFSVNNDGNITAVGGTIGGWSLSSSQITAGSVVSDDAYGQYVTLSSSASMVAYRKDFNYGIGEYWTKVDVNSGNPGLTVTGNSNGYSNTSAIRSSNISTRLFIHNEYTDGAGYGKFTASGSHVYFGDGSGSYTMRIVNTANLYGQGTGGVATLDVLVNANGTLVAPSSSIRFKENINNLNIDYKKILSIQPVSFFYKDDSEVPEGAERAVEYGVIAEQVEEAGVPELVNYKDGVPFSVPYSKMPVFLLEVCRKQQELIEDLQSRISLLESK